MESRHKNILKFEREYWDARYRSGRDSGVGSYGNEVEIKLKFLVELINSVYPEVKTILDVGCGDFNLGKQLLDRIPEDVTYLGLDVSEAIVSRNNNSYGSDRIKFEVFDFQPIQADLVICMDVLFHIIEDADYERMVKYLNMVYGKYLTISQIGGWEKLPYLAPHMGPRNIDRPEMFGKLLNKFVIPLPGEVTTKDIYLFV